MMIRCFNIKYFTICVVCFCRLLFGDSGTISGVGTAAGNWLKIEAGVRAAGLGGANVAVGNSVADIPFNPASLAFIKGTQLYGCRTAYLADISHNVLSFGTQLTFTDYLGLHLFYLDSGDMEETTEEQPEGTGRYFKVLDLAFSTTYAKQLTDRFRFGLTLKYIQEKIDNMSMKSFAIDVGSNFDTGIYGFILGMSVSNFGPDVQFHGPGLHTDVDGTSYSEITEKFTLPMTFRLGMKNDVIGDIKSEGIHRLTLSADGINPIDNVLYYGVGVEYAWKELAFVRAGTHIGHDTAGFGLGLGVDIVRFSVDYAFSMYGILENTHQFGLRFGF